MDAAAWDLWVRGPEGTRPIVARWIGVLVGWLKLTAAPVAAAVQ
jgi:hypothetical protein